MPFLGCIADDFTGATDLGSMLVRGGMRCVQWLGVPSPLPVEEDVDAVVVSLKSRSNPPDEAIRDSLLALKALQQVGCERFLFKYCSTFDSTDRGNIGPVAEALLRELKTEQTVFCPAFPENGRTVFQGHLFVGDRLLNESGMENHPLNPMTDANLVRVLSRQSHATVGFIPTAIVEAGPSAIQQELKRLAAAEVSLIIADASREQHLDDWGEALVEETLVTGGSAIASSLGRAYRRHELIRETSNAATLPSSTGMAAILAGSCSTATQRQVAEFSKHRPVFTLDPRRLAGGEPVVAEALAWAEQQMSDGPVLITSTASPDQIAAVQAEVGERAAALVENAMAAIASGLVELGVRQLIVAGGETSGAVIKALNISALQIGPEIDPGVPWTVSTGGLKMALALKSGNFGGEDFFLRAWEMLG